MSVTGKRRLRSVIEEAIESKHNIKDITADTFRQDAAVILESILAEFDELLVLDALTHQGLEAKAYLSTLRKLADIARRRRSERTTRNEPDQG